MQIFEIYFLNPFYFFLVIFLFLFLYFFRFFRKKLPIYSSFSDLNKVFKTSSFLYFFRFFLIIFIFLGFVFLLANPNLKNISKNDKKNGIDIVLAFDISTSMLAYDLSPNRLEKAKEVVAKFLEKQKTNRVWLVVFAWKPFSSVPLTFDYEVLKEAVLDLETSDINQDYFSGTAVWDAILWAKNIFKKDEKREKVIIVLTDWDTNTWVSPQIAAVSASEEKIKIFTVWIGSDKTSFADIQSWPFLMKVEVPPLNWKELQEIAKITSWQFFRAIDNNSLEDIFRELEKLEKNETYSKNDFVFSDLYDYFAYFISFLIFLLILTFLKINNVFYKSKHF